MKVLVKLLGLSIIAIPPLLGAWLASSLTAYLGGPYKLAVAAGLLLFPVLPLLWEIGAVRRRARKGIKTPPYLAPYARFILRTLVVSVVFIATLVVIFPRQAFPALAVRGDWFLEGDDSDTARMARDGVHQAAKGLEWLYTLTVDDPYRQWADDTPLPENEQPKPSPPDRPNPPDPPDPPDPGEQKTPDPQAKKICIKTEDGVEHCVDAPSPKPTQDENERAARAGEWPAPRELHPVVRAMTAKDEATMQAVATHIKDRTKPGRDRVRALHDWVADRIAYDGEAFRTRNIPAQDADTVFRRRIAVCAGYSLLLKRLGQLAGEDILYVTGDAGGAAGLERHAWNAARVDGGWVLLDSTWDAGYLDDEFRFVKSFDTAYAFPPPIFFAASHFPEERRWQLLERPIDRGEFLRMPKLQADFFRAHLTLKEPQRSQVDAIGSVDVVVDNPDGRYLSATACKDGKCDRCKNEGKGATRLTCALPETGSYRVRLFAAVGSERGMLDQVLEVDVTSR